MDSLTDLFLPLALSLALGLLVGLERGWHGRENGEGARVAGVRTYGLIGLLGGFAGVISEALAPVFGGLAFAGLAGVLVAAYLLSERTRTDVGITSLVAGLLVFAFGMAATLGYLKEAAAGAVATAVVLGYKTTLHSWVEALTRKELRATLKLLLISVVVLPVLPNQGFGPWAALNPFEIWWMVVLIAAISFSGYFAMKIVGPDKGALVTGLLAGLASSTALTLHFARLARRGRGDTVALSVGVLIACGTMFPRMLVVIGIVHLPLLQPLLAPVLTMAATVYASALALWLTHRRHRDKTEAAPVDNPLDLPSALLFGGLLAIIMLAAAGLEAYAGDSGILALAAISGISDVDAISLTLASMSADHLAGATAVLGLVVAGAVNSVVKGAITFGVGGRGIGLRVGIPLIAAAGIGLAIALSMPAMAG